MLEFDCLSKFVVGFVVSGMVDCRCLCILQNVLCGHLIVGVGWYCQ